LGLIYERYQSPRLNAEKVALRDADLDLESVQDGIRAGHPDAASRLAIWQADAAGLRRKLAAGEDQSLFNPAKLAGFVKRTAH
jgi:hypothetical protein